MPPIWVSNKALAALPYGPVTGVVAMSPLWLTVGAAIGTLFTRGMEKAMTREEMVRLLKNHKATLAERFGVTDLALFGSMARGEARESSDLDILVDFDGPATSRRYFGVQFYLEDLLGAPVDLVTEKALRNELRPYVEKDAIHV